MMHFSVEKALYVTFWICSFTLLWAQSPRAFSDTVQAGRLDLSGATWTSPVSLQGEWRYHPGRFLTEDEARAVARRPEHGTLVHIPGSLLYDPRSPNQKAEWPRWGTLLLEIEGLRAPDDWLGLQLRGDTAYDVYMIDLDRPTPMKRVIQVGKVGSDKESAIPQIASALEPWNPGDSQHFLLMVHISGFHYTDINLWTIPRLGLHRTLEHELKQTFLLDAFVAGALCLMSLYYLSLFFHQRENKAALLLSIFGCSVFIRHIGCSPSIQQVLFPEPSLAVFRSFRIFEYGVVCMMGGAGAWFAVESFQVKRLERLAQILLGLGVAFMIFCIISSTDIFPLFVLPINLILFFQVLIYLAVASWALYHRALGSFGLLLGGALTALSVFNDMAITFGLITSSLFLAPVGMTLLIFANGQIVAQHFARAFRTAHRLGQSLQEEVERQTLRIRSMLDNIPQGIMSVVVPGVADTEYSKQLTQILETEIIAQKTFKELVLEPSTLSQDEQHRILAALDACLGEDALNFELNAAQLPGEIMLTKAGKTKYLQLNWAPLLTTQNSVKSIQVTFNDLTHLRDVERESQSQKQELAYIEEILHAGVEHFPSFVETTEHLLGECRRLVESNSRGSESIVRILFINMHTIKGTARTLGLKKFANLIHGAEQHCIEALHRPQELWQQDIWLQELGAMEAMLAEYLHVFHNTLGHQKSQESSSHLSTAYLEKIYELWEQWLRHPRSEDLSQKILELAPALEESLFTNAEAFFQGFAPAVARIARDLGKEPPLFLVHAPHVLLSHAAEKALSKALIHALRNSLDHGIESKDERRAQHKPGQGRIEIDVTEAGNHLRIRLKDDGRGLALHALKEKAHRLGETLSLQATADLIFRSGLSTAQELSEISGRGMGMDALRKFIRDIGGDVSLELLQEDADAAWLPFQLLIDIPAHAWRHSLAYPGSRDMHNRRVQPAS
jgi:hypothetical protein